MLRAEENAHHAAGIISKKPQNFLTRALWALTETQYYFLFAGAAKKQCFSKDACVQRDVVHPIWAPAAHRGPSVVIW